MSREHELQRSVRVRRQERAEEEDSAGSRSEREDLDTEEEEEDRDGSEDSSNDTEESAIDGNLEVSSTAEEDHSSSLKDISFGALVKAQQSFAPPRPGKRKRTLDSDHQDQVSTQRGTSAPSEPSKVPKLSRLSRPVSRTSKHAPQTLSTRHAVTRKRAVFESSSSLKSRDPRFDPTITTTSSSNLPLESEKANKNYAFLTTYRQSELQALQSQLKAAQNPTTGRNKKKRSVLLAPPTDPEQIAYLKREIQSLSSKIASSTTKNREAEILQAHKQKEREAIREGRKSKPFYLKKGEVRKEIEREQVEGLGKRAREKKELRKRKREKGREGRGLPRVRRAVVGEERR